MGAQPANELVSGDVGAGRMERPGRTETGQCLERARKPGQSPSGGWLI
jgi:hypothetical protein